MLEKLSTIEPDGWDKEQIKLEIPKLQEEVVELVRKLIAEKKKGLLVVIQGKCHSVLCRLFTFFLFYFYYLDSGTLFIII